MGRTALSDRRLTFEVSGATASDGDGWAGRPGFRSYERSVRIGEGSTRWDFASQAILRWGVKTRSGFTVRDDTGTSGGGQRVVLGDRFWLFAHLGPLRVSEPVQVVNVIDDPDRKGFAYGTLTGHPISGEEAFLVERRGDGSVWLTIRSIARPPVGIWRAAYPAVLIAQRLYRRRYLRALAGRM
jgi:uncharacterized protein (UPF0548 family)